MMATIKNCTLVDLGNNKLKYKIEISSVSPCLDFLYKRLFFIMSCSLDFT